MAYVPSKGDVVWLDFDPQAGHEQSGRRMALVLSPRQYNEKTQLIICCPLTSQIKGYPFEVATLIRGKKGVVLADHIKSLDWRARKAEKICSASEDILNDVLAKIESLLSN